MTWAVLPSIQVQSWLVALDEETIATVLDCISELTRQGPQLGRPLVGKLSGSMIANLKELRPITNQHGHIRIIFAFDPKRQAVLLLAGDKRGQWDKWYKKHIPIAERMFLDHLTTL
jgi:hypothetical protein